jgi:hypothetical protein
MCEFVGCQSATGENNFGLPRCKGGRGCTGKRGAVRIKEGERETAEARRAKEVRWVQKRIKVDKAIATKNEKEEEAGRRMTAVKRRSGAKRQKFCVKRQRQCFERTRGEGTNATTNRQMIDYHSGSKGNGNGDSDNDSCGNGNDNCDGNRKFCAAAVANDHLAGDATVGAVGIVNDGYNVGGGRGPSGFDKNGHPGPCG